MASDFFVVEYTSRRPIHPVQYLLVGCGLCLFYLLWRIKGGSLGAIPALGVVTLSLFFTKSIFQLPVILLIGLSLYMLHAPKRLLGR